MKYRKKPVVIEAIQLTNDTKDKIIDWIGDSYLSHDFHGIEIKTLEGKHLASLNDFIIQGIAGEFYPCKPDIFEATYEPVENEELL